MWLQWLPWRFVVRYFARSHGFLDPVRVMGRLERFSQPSEVWAPFELLRAGAVFHARGLINSRAIQHNLDWVWPYWVEQQFNPLGRSFIPRAFSLTHVNLTHRNWTAVGLPGFSSYSLVDPRGLVTPLFGGWSLDCWILTDDSFHLLPSRQESVEQGMDTQHGVSIHTVCRENGLELESSVETILRAGAPVCRMQVAGRAPAGGQLILSLRPYNPEGVSFIHEIRELSGGHGWLVNGKDRVDIHPRPDSRRYSCYREGDVSKQTYENTREDGVACDVGMATAAAVFMVEPGMRREMAAEIPLEHGPAHPGRARCTAEGLWQRGLEGAVTLRIPDSRIRYLHDAALRTLILHAPGEVFAGPYTYKRFWFRDAVFITHALLCLGLTRRAERIISRFPSRQTRSGYFLSQNGEWDSNGQVLWLLGRFRLLSGRMPTEAWKEPVMLGAQWIRRKRTSSRDGTAHAGLLPPGFSAEHLGPNDFYYWDDFWAVAGLRAAAGLLEEWGMPGEAGRNRAAAEDLERCIERSLRGAFRRIGRPAMPASPHRRLDSGSVGSLAAGYPLQLWDADDPRLLDTAEYLINSSLVRGGFYHDIIHSGINPYLSLHIAQVLLRGGDSRWFSILQSISDLASPTGQWPEAVHPGTGGGCMGDGQHAWASAEWAIMLRNCFLREEERDQGLILCSGIPESWRRPGALLHYGPAPTSYGTVTVELEAGQGSTRVSWKAQWRETVPRVEVRLPGHDPVIPEPGSVEVTIPDRESRA